MLLLVGATEVTGAARAGADSLPNCATTPETTTEGCGYYINQSGVVGGTSVLAGESSASPTDIAIGGPLEQTATVMANPGVYDVTMSWLWSDHQLLAAGRQRDHRIGRRLSGHLDAARHSMGLRRSPPARCSLWTARRARSA